MCVCVRARPVPACVINVQKVTYHQKQIEAVKLTCNCTVFGFSRHHSLPKGSEITDKDGGERERWMLPPLNSYCRHFQWNCVKQEILFLWRIQKTKQKTTTNKQTNFFVQLRWREAGGLECSGQISLAVSDCLRVL